ncbi:DUF438 domain-containing protein [Bacillus sp. DTU_2020_1000418_1_SI_GHA_SEK_038]|uniref:DUF438 domain-containing protein n=1 Tax=Bacillus sp. DTU_2020_1000418_1_SI_GHA_SEK_038 TaxID=3077585 RepID=UPI0028E76D6D|nr:DUF438 domain-containing protein [Bacillus sp. DTU_2020_1000418_1_SI_GHA_SEK_038]WNS77462.1 DUF438 domain-containing protein [Bacillus sp. DTU_2020_1000418_1_SI_GHA_SEK_038]
MSEVINNREHTIKNTERQTVLKQIFVDLHNGRNVDEVKAHFNAFIGKITIEEITQLQHDLMEEGGIPLDDLQRLYAAHTDIFRGSIEEAESTKKPENEPGHPIHTFIQENHELDKLIKSKVQIHLQQFIQEDTAENVYKLLEDCNLLLDIDKHYSRKENLLFPYLEKYGIYGPTNNMWRIDDFIRDGIKEAKRKLSNYDGNKQEIVNLVHFIMEEVINMIYREEHILFPMALKNLTEDEWVKIAHESDEIGYCLTSPAEEWKPERKQLGENAISEGYIKMETGILSLKQLELLLNHLPVDITFIDQDDVVRYFSHGKERIFARTKAVIGRTVQNCHPPRSVHVVEELLADFKSGRKDTEDFWIKFRDKYVYIRYFAVRDENENYIGTLEFTQNIDPIKAIEGEKRILS